MGSLSDIIGQRAAKQRILPLLRGKPEHAYLITGPEGIGKRLFAEVMAKALLCLSPGEDGACTVCAPCRYFEEKTHPDFIHLFPNTGDKYIRVAAIRESVVRDVFIFPQFSARKVYLIEADYLNEEGQNALLKTLEEPPGNVVLILTVSDTDRLLDTVVSRSVRIPLSPNTEREIIDILVKRLNSSETDALKIAALSKGIPGLALKMSGDETLLKIREEIADLISNISEISLCELLTVRFAFFEKNKERIDEVLTVLHMGMGDIAASLARQMPLLRVFDKRDKMMRMIRQNSVHAISVDRASICISETAKAIRSNYNFEASICSMLLTIRKELCHAQSSAHSLS